MTTESNRPESEMGLFAQWSVASLSKTGGMPEILLCMMILAWLCSIFLRWPTRYSMTTLALAIAGFSSFSVAKFSMFRQGRWISFGSSSMTPRNRAFYRFGYGLIVCSVIMSIPLLMMSGKSPQ